MFRRSILRAASLAPARTAPGRRFISTEPPHLRGRSWKSSAARWGIAIAGLYYYNTSPVFAEEPQSNLLNPNLDALDDHDTSSLDALTSKKSRRKEKGAQLVHTAADAVSSENASTSVTEQPLTVTDTPQPGAAELEDEAESEGAFNPETGEINWDCPCLGGMAHGPCGPQFREAFSCFVYSSEEPKGMDCIEKFQGMRDCFHEHPDVYKDEIMDDEDIDRELEAERETEQQGLTDKIAARQKADNESGRRLLEEAAPEPKPSKTTRAPSDESKRPSQKTSKSSSASQSTTPSVSEVPSVEPIPASAHDARGEVAES